MEKTSTSDLIKKYRIEKGLTQKQLGKKCGINEANIRKYELGTQNPKLKTLKRIAEALDIPVLNLFDPEDVIPYEAFLDVFLRPHTPKEEIGHIENFSQGFADIKDTLKIADEEFELLKKFRQLNDYGKKEAQTRIFELTKIKIYTKCQISENEF